MKTYDVKVTFNYTGIFHVKANSKAEAKKNVEEDCAMTLSSGIHSTLMEKDVNWDFPVHPEKKIVSIK